MDEKNVEELISEFNKILESRGFENWTIRKIKFEEGRNIKQNLIEGCKWVEIPPNSGKWEEICN